jgi:hypothetical protein
VLVVALASLISSVGVPAFAQDPPLPAISVGAGMRTSFVHTEFEGFDDDEDEDADTNTDRFLLDSARLYVNGSVTKNIKFMFNTEYDGSGDIEILDAAARLEFSPGFNIWMGRFLPPSDRANLYGPYYAHHWNVYQDGVQDGYPFIFQGRANGAMYWGQYGKMKVSAGLFDGPSINVTHPFVDDDNVLAAGRLQYNFWDAEDGYYLNSTYYGEKNLLSVGLAGQVQGEDNTAWSADFLLEQGVGMGGAYTIEAEFARYTRLGGYPNPGPFLYDTNDGGYVLGSYLFPAPTGIGRFEVLGKIAVAKFKGGSLFEEEKQTTTEINLNYIMKQFNARLMMFFMDTRYDETFEASNFWKVGAGLQLQM